MKKLKEFRDFFNNNIKSVLDCYIDEDIIKEQIMYALHGGKRLRPVIVLSLAYNKDKNAMKCIKFAIAIELIHTSSLILDDLPSMDNDCERRNQPSFHIKYSVMCAQIISGLILNLALKLIYDNFTGLTSSTNLNKIMNIISKNLGMLGAAGGQYLDLTPFTEFNRNNLKNKKNIEDLFQMKTTSFFEISFMGGYLLNYKDEYNEENEKKILQASTLFGLCFQIYDDFDDINQDKLRNNNGLFDPNYINNFGKEVASKEFNTALSSFISIMKELKLLTPQLIEICYLLNNKVKNHI